MGSYQVETLEDLKKLVGQELAVTNYRLITQEQVNQFATVGRDGQWIHTDVERAKQESPYAGTIAHGFLELALISDFMNEAVTFATPLKMVLNYGLDRVRFPAPVLVGSKLRARVKLAELKDIPGGYQATWNVTMECEGAAKPSCVADWLIRYIA